MIVKIVHEEDTYDGFTLTIRHVTKGKIMVLRHALEKYQTESIIGAETLEELNRGIANCRELQEFLQC